LRLPVGSLFIGEVGLGGEVRPVDAWHRDFVKRPQQTELCQ